MFSFIETKLFTRHVQEYLSDDEYQKLQTLLMEQPDAGRVVPGSGGVRKLASVDQGGASAAATE